MAITFAIPVTAHGESFPIELTRIDRETVDQGTTVPAPNGGSETVYKFVVGDPSHKSQVRVGDYPPSKNGASYNKSVRLTTVATKTNSITGEVETKPISCVISTSDGFGVGVLDDEDYLALVAMTFSVLVPGSKVSDDAPETAAVHRLAFGSTEVMHVAVEQ